MGFLKSGIVLKWYSRAVLFVAPLFFLPLVNDAYGIGKMWFLLASFVLGLLIWVGESFLKGEFRIKAGRWWVWGLVILGLALASWWRMPLGGQSWGMLSPLGLGLLVSLWGWLFLWVQIGDREGGVKSLTWSGILALVLSLVLFLWPEAKLPLIWPSAENPWFVLRADWSPTGSVLNISWWFILLSVLWWGKVKKTLKEGSGANSALVFLGVMLLGVALSVYRLWQIKLVLLDIFSAWAIAVETFKRQPFLGVGPGNFLTAFNLFRPVEFNVGAAWAGKFMGSRSAILQWWTEMGTLSLVVLVWGLVSRLRGLKMRDGFWWGLLLAVVSLFVLPSSVMLWFFLVWVLSLTFQGEGKVLPLKLGESINLGLLMICGLVFVFLGAGFWRWWVPGLRSELWMMRSLRAAAAGRGVDVYNLQVKAVSLMPTLVDNRIVYSQTNLSLASGILSNRDASDEDKQQAVTLIQQSIDEAKAAVALDQNSAAAWQNLAYVYRSIIGLVEGADQWTVASFEQAIASDPANPILRVDLGGIFYGLGQYAQADGYFEQAVRLKRDYANAWYNWAYAAKQAKNDREAVMRMQQVLALVSPETEDYTLVFGELEKWQKDLDAQEATVADQTKKEVPMEEKLVQPQVLPTTEPVVDLPESAGPEITPTVKPEVTESPEVDQ